MFLVINIGLVQKILTNLFWFLWTWMSLYSQLGDGDIDIVVLVVVLKLMRSIMLIESCCFFLLSDNF